MKRREGRLLWLSLPAFRVRENESAFSLQERWKFTVSFFSEPLLR